MVIGCLQTALQLLHFFGYNAVFQNVSDAIFLPHCGTRSDKGNRKTSARRQSLVLSVKKGNAIKEVTSEG